MGLRLILSFAFLLQSVAQAAGAPASVISPRVKTQINDFQKLNTHATPCRGQTVQACSPVISDLVAQEKEDKFFGLIKNEHDTCTKWIAGDQNSKVFKTPLDLSRNLGDYQFNGMVAADSYVINRCLSGDNVRSKEAVSKYYYYAGRMNASQASDLEELADLDRILNEGPVLSGIACDSIPFDRNRSRCQELQKACRPTGGLDEVAQQAQDDLNEIEGLEKEVSKLKEKSNGRTTGDEVKRRKDLIKANEFKIEMIKGRSPVLKGSTFTKERSRNFKEAVRHQLQDNRKTLSRHLAEVNQKHQCMTGTRTSQSCSSEKVRDFIDKETHGFPEFFDVKKGRNRDEAVMGGNYLNFQQCLHTTKVKQLKDNEFVSGAVISAALSLATLGVGSVFSGAKAVMTVRQAQLATAAKTFVAAVDAGNFGKAVAEAGQACLSNEKVMKGDQKAAGSSCNPTSTLSSRVAMKAHDDCTMRLAMAALAGVPVGVGVAQRAAQASRLSKSDQILLRNGVTREDIELEKAALKRGEMSQARKNFVSNNAVLDNSTRFQKIKENFKNLSDEQIDCVVNLVHPIGAGRGVYNYEKMDIWQKGRTLRRVCNIASVEDTRALLEFGYAGELPAGPATSEFLKMLEKPFGNPGAQAGQSSVQTIDDMKSQATELEKQVAQTTDPLKKVQLRDELNSLQQKIVAETLEQNPQGFRDSMAALDKVRGVSVSTEKAQIGSPDAIKLSPEKVRQLDKAAGADSTGLSATEKNLIEIKPGDQMYFKSDSFGNGLATIKKADPDHPGHIIVEFIDQNSNKVRTVSMPQTDIAMTNKETAEAAAAIMKDAQRKGGNSFQELLKKDFDPKKTGEAIADAMAKNAGRSPQQQQADALLEKMNRIEAQYGQNRTGIFTNPEYLEASKKFHQLTQISKEENQTLRALYEIDVNKPKASAEDLKVLAEAKKIRDSKSETALPSETRASFKQIELVEKQLETAPKRFADGQVNNLLKMNGSSSFGRVSNYPSQASFQKSFSPQSEYLTNSEKQNYKAMENLFKEDPRSLSDESAQWLRTSGHSFYQKFGNGAGGSDPNREYFLNRLKIYLDVYRSGH